MQIFLTRWITAAGIILSCGVSGSGQALDKMDSIRQQAKMDWWRKARFGMFIHWGVYAVPAGSYKGKYYEGSLGEWLMQDAKIPRAEYAQFAKSFNPSHYDPEQWVLLAKQAGMKYIVITAKHHDGFALFGSAASTWNIVEASPYGKDLLEPLVKACRKNNMKIGFYYSQANDWYNPGGAAAYGHWDSTQQTRSMDEYIDKVAVPQVREILTRYGDVAELWWDVPSDMTPQRAARLKALLSLQPNIIINDRLGGDVPGDITTPEQYVPATGIPGRDWETCMTMNDTWGFKSKDTNWKTTLTLIQNLVDIASKGGNYLLNVGPDAEGRFPQAITLRLQEVGKWMDKYGESIYATSASPFRFLPWGRCTIREDNGETTLYFHVFRHPGGTPLLVPGLKNEIISASAMATGKTVAVTRTEEGVSLMLPAEATEGIVPVIKVKVKGKVIPDAYVVRPGSLGSFDLLPQQSTIENKGEGAARLEGGDEANIGWWTDAASSVAWTIKVAKAGTFNLWGRMSTTADSSRFNLQIGDQKIACQVYNTGGYDDYREVELGRISVPAPGVYTVRMSPDPAGWRPLNLRSIQVERKGM